MSVPVRLRPQNRRASQINRKVHSEGRGKEGHLQKFWLPELRHRARGGGQRGIGLNCCEAKLLPKCGGGTAEGAVTLGA